jgi:hypothetical protein
MNEEPRSWQPKLWRLVKTFGWLILAVLIAQQIWWAPFRADAARARVIERFQQERKSRVIAMIHRMDTQSIFGVPVSQSITIEDSEAILRAIRLTQPEQPLDLILHTPGGLVLAAEQIAKALVEHELMDLYPQGRAGRPSVLYVPVRRERDLPRDFGGSEPPRAPEEK